MGGFLENMEYTMKSGPAEEDGVGGGVKGMTTLAVFAIMVNSMNGPGLLAIPAVFQRAGWFPCTVGIVAGGYITAETCVFLYDCVQMVKSGRLGGGDAADDGGGSNPVGYGAVGTLGGVEKGGGEDGGKDGARKGSGGGGGREEGCGEGRLGHAQAPATAAAAEATRFGMEALATRLLGARWGAVTQCLMICALVTLVIAQIVVTSQAVDGLIVFVCGATWGIQYAPTWLGRC